MSRLKNMRRIRVSEDFILFPNRRAAIRLLAEQHNKLLDCCLELEKRVEWLEDRMRELGVGE